MLGGLRQAGSLHTAKHRIDPKLGRLGGAPGAIKIDFAILFLASRGDRSTSKTGGVSGSRICKLTPRLALGNEGHPNACALYGDAVVCTIYTEVLILREPPAMPSTMPG